jgi:hypothetical protein
MGPPALASPPCSRSPDGFEDRLIPFASGLDLGERNQALSLVAGSRRSTDSAVLIHASLHHQHRA